jgi:hypothetical protein
MSTSEGRSSSPPLIPKTRPFCVDDIDTMAGRERFFSVPSIVDTGGAGDDDNNSNKVRTYSNYSSDDSAFGGFGTGSGRNNNSSSNNIVQPVSPTPTHESIEDEEIRFAKEMALAIAKNPNMTPDQLRELQQNRTKQRVTVEAVSTPAPVAVAVAVATTPTSAGKPMKSIRASLKKASMKAVSAVVPGGVIPKGSSNSARASSSPLAATSPVSSAAGPGSATASGSTTPLPMMPSTNASTRSINGGANNNNPRPSARLGDFLDSQKETSISTGSGGVPPSMTDCDRSNVSYTGGGTSVATNPSGQIRLTGIVWKRRSGLGKYSTSAAWERRRVVLQGTRLLYYKTLVDTKEDESNVGDNDDGGYGEDDGGGEVGGATAATAAAAVGAWLGMRTTTTAGMGGGGGGGSKGSARGYLDLLKEQSSVSASYGHTGAPTPFAISIKVMSQTKWKLCFDTQDELMEWLAAMTDVVVQGSVDTYNAQILEANDPRSVLGASGLVNVSEPPKIGHAGTKTGAGGHRLWSTCHYRVQSDNYPEENVLEEMIAEGELEDDDESDTDGDNCSSNNNVGADRGLDTMVFGTGEVELSMADPSAVPKDVWGVPADQLFHVVVLLNLALCLARASAVSVDMFWHLITFTNIALLGVLSKEKVEGIVTTSSKVDSGFALKSGQRRSSRLSLPPSSAAAKSVKDVTQKASITSAAPDKSTSIATVQVGNVKPVAGSTGMRIENPTDLPVNKDGVIFAGWRTADPSIMQIRSLGYKKTKAKVASPGQLYKCIDLDIFESQTRHPDMASRVTLPKVVFNDKGPKTWNAPDLFVITIAIPTDTPKLYGPTENGGGYTISIYFAMEQDTRDILKRVTADGYNPADEKKSGDANNSKVNAVRLLEEWCRRAPTDDAFMARFKVLPNAQNLKEIGLPSWISKYNGKPFLIKRPGQTGFLYRHPEKSVVEFDISLHPFPYLAKQGICYMKDAYFKKVLVTFGFLIEGRADDELPECLIGLFQLCYPDPIHAIQGDDFFSGKSPSSKL